MPFVDLHVHTTASDGTLSPAEAVALARKTGLAAIAVTDHDTQDGVAEALAAGEALGVEVVPGIELNCDWHGYGIHILGYFVQPDGAPMHELLDWVIAERRRRNERIVSAMRRDGLPVELDELEQRYSGSVLGRPHFAAELVRLGRADSIKDAFDRWLNRGCAYYSKRVYVPMHLAFSTLRAAGGKAVFAHPFQYRLPEPELLALTGELVGRGLSGVECIYHGYSPEQTAYLKDLAGHYGLCVTGGSDFHGDRKPNRLGSPPVDAALLEALRAR